MRDVHISFIETIREAKDKDGNDLELIEDIILVYFIDELTYALGNTVPQCVWQFSTGYDSTYKPNKKCDECRIFFSAILLILLYVLSTLLWMESRDILIISKNYEIKDFIFIKNDNLEKSQLFYKKTHQSIWAREFLIYSL